MSRTNSPPEMPGPLDLPSHDNVDTRRTPSYSLDRALALLETGQEFSLAKDDYVTGRIYEYLAQMKRCTTYAQRRMLNVRMHAVASSYKVYKENGLLRWVLEAYLLTNLDFDEIGSLVGLGVDVVYWYEQIYYRVRDRLAARDWIVQEAIGKSVHSEATKHDLDIILKWLAFYGGWTVLELCLTHILPDEDGDMSHSAEAARGERVRCLVEALCISGEEAFRCLANLAEAIDQEDTALPKKQLWEQLAGVLDNLKKEPVPE